MDYRPHVQYLIIQKLFCKCDNYTLLKISSRTGNASSTARASPQHGFRLPVRSCVCTYTCESFRPGRHRRTDVTTLNRAPPVPPKLFSFHNKERLKSAASRSEQSTTSRTSTNTQMREREREGLRIREASDSNQPLRFQQNSLNHSHIMADCLGSTYKLNGS